MRINHVTNSVNFRAALTSKAAKEMDKLCNEAEKVLHPQGTYTLFDFHNYSMSSSSNADTGIGKYTSDDAVRMVKTMKPYTGMNGEKIYPIGRFINKGSAEIKFFCPYERGGLTVGEDNIDFEQLTGPNYSFILSQKSLKRLVNSNKETETPLKINYENEFGQNFEMPIMNLLREAYGNFKALPANSPLKAEFEEYKKKPVVESYDRLALYQFVSKDEPDLFKDFASSPEKQQKFEDYKEEYKDEIEFYKFNQFIAFKQMQEAKKKYNAEGVEIFGDVAIGFNAEEHWAFADAFNQDKSIGYNFLLPKYEELDDKSTEAYKLLHNEMTFAAELFDGVRLDVGASYGFYPYMQRKEDGSWDGENKKVYNFGNDVFKFIEDTFKEVKGEDYDLTKITYEVGPGEAVRICGIDGESHIEAIKPMADKGLILVTQYEGPDDFIKTPYGSVDFFIKSAGISPDVAYIGTGNHDNTPVRQIAEDNNEMCKEKRKRAIPVLQEALNVSKEFLQNPKNFFKAKMAEIQLSSKRFLYYMDVFGDNKAINDWQGDQTEHKRFRDRLSRTYERDFHQKLQQDMAYNRPEVLTMALKAKGLENSDPVLYQKLEYLGEHLRKKGELTTREADLNAEIEGRDVVLDKLNEIDRKGAK